MIRTRLVLVFNELCVQLIKIRNIHRQQTILYFSVDFFVTNQLYREMIVHKTEHRSKADLFVTKIIHNISPTQRKTRKNINAQN